MIKNVCNVERILVKNSLCTDAGSPLKKRSGRETSLSQIFPQGREASVHRLAIERLSFMAVDKLSTKILVFF